MTVEAWQVAFLVLFAVLTGAALPLALQLWRTLASAQKLADQVGPRLVAVVDQVEQVTKTIDEIRKSVRIAAALGAAVAPTAAAFARGLRGDSSNGHATASEAAGQEVPHA